MRMLTDRVTVAQILLGYSEASSRSIAQSPLLPADQILSGLIEAQARRFGFQPPECSNRADRRAQILASLRYGPGWRSSLRAGQYVLIVYMLRSIEKVCLLFV